MKKEIYNYLLEHKIKPNLSGFNYLYKAIEFGIDNTGKPMQVTKTIYPKVAEDFESNSYRIERAIRHAIRKSDKKYCSLTNGEFISMAIIELSLKNL